jgi:hypothetical protein
MSGATDVSAGLGAQIFPATRGRQPSKLRYWVIGVVLTARRPLHRLRLFRCLDDVLCKNWT